MISNFFRGPFFGGGPIRVGGSFITPHVGFGAFGGFFNPQQAAAAYHIPVSMIHGPFWPGTPMYQHIGSVFGPLLPRLPFNSLFPHLDEEF